MNTLIGPFYMKNGRKERERRENIEHRQLCEQAKNFDQALDGLIEVLTEGKPETDGNKSE